MPKLKELNEAVSLGQQMQSDENGSIVLFNVFTVDPADEDELVAAWSRDAEFMKLQPGYISTQLHKGVGGSATYLNYAIWENIESFRNAFTNPEFQRRMALYPDSATASPHLFKKIGVPSHCVE